MRREAAGAALDRAVHAAPTMTRPPAFARAAAAAAPPCPALARLEHARRLTDALLDRVRPDRLYERPIAERHRFVFYLGHLDAFDRNLLAAALDEPRSHAFDTLFASGIDPLDGALPEEAPAAWPDVREIDDYIASTRRRLDTSLPRVLASERMGGGAAPLAFVLDAAIEHRLMHAETLAYLLHRSRARRPLRRGLPARELAAEFVRIPAGTATLGRRRDDWRTFGWDNEYGEQPVEVEQFQIARRMVSNGEFRRFVDAGGYEDPAHWSPADWRWRIEHDVAHPPFWERAADRWCVSSVSERLPLPLDWPVYVSHAEAAAYARWAGAGLPTEAQWHRAAYGTPQGAERAYPWGTEAPAARHGNFDFHDERPHAVDAHPDGASAFGVEGLLGNGWEWTATPFAPLPGFEPFAFYAGYSADFFDGRHYVLKGGAPFTAACLLRRSFRNWFQPHYPHVHAGFRCARNG
ncbi:SUMF1/EgtB/PvdO family nonheme iron enzyme [Dokdonella sp.]|uniref:SUMF1/EgtB/PvdO family nonheme iron enzyme n=1 Tax=Dokdonella sp. TaxID=2291710 RepID=UPI001B05FB4F|nr:SUMF1/EgtB/PvdO family nonheme iron enzyme [Dokdonella sp.]MBO9662883.1 SUMF1/EgtB/PvdO family nonheme iron enzyme [Dokdonella sp.]